MRSHPLYTQSLLTIRVLCQLLRCCQSRNHWKITPCCHLHCQIQCHHQRGVLFVCLKETGKDVLPRQHLIGLPNICSKHTKRIKEKRPTQSGWKTLDRSKKRTGVCYSLGRFAPISSTRAVGGDASTSRNTGNYKSLQNTVKIKLNSVLKQDGPFFFFFSTPKSTVAHKGHAAS